MCVCVNVCVNGLKICLNVNYKPKGFGSKIQLQEKDGKSIAKKGEGYKCKEERTIQLQEKDEDTIAKKGEESNWKKRTDKQLQEKDEDPHPSYNCKEEREGMITDEQDIYTRET